MYIRLCPWARHGGRQKQGRGADGHMGRPPMVCAELLKLNLLPRSGGSADETAESSRYDVRVRAIWTESAARRSCVVCRAQVVSLGWPDGMGTWLHALP